MYSSILQNSLLSHRLCGLSQVLIVALGAALSLTPNVNEDEEGSTNCGNNRAAWHRL